MTLPQETLNNLARTGQIKPEPAHQGEFDGLIKAAKRKLPDAALEALSADSRFILAYDAAHSLALAALRWHGFRADNRFIVFQLLGTTVQFPTGKWRLLDECHHKRNVALYDGSFVEDERLIQELIATTHELLRAVESLGPVNPP